MIVTSLTLWLICHIARALAASRAENCAAACFNALTPLKFKDIDADATYYTGLCNSTLLIDSTYACFATYCSQYSAANSFGVVDSDCTDYGFITLTSYKDTISSMQLSAVPTVQILEEINMINNTVLPDKDYFDTSFRTLVIPVPPILIWLVLTRVLGDMGLRSAHAPCLRVRSDYPLFSTHD